MLNLSPLSQDHSTAQKRDAIVRWTGKIAINNALFGRPPFLPWNRTTEKELEHQQKLPIVAWTVSVAFVTLIKTSGRRLPPPQKGLCMALNSRCDIPGEINAISVKIWINSMSWFDIPIASECHRYDFSKRYKLQREGRFFRPSIKYLKLMESINTARLPSKFNNFYTLWSRSSKLFVSWMKNEFKEVSWRDSHRHNKVLTAPFIHWPWTFEI